MTDTPSQFTLLRWNTLVSPRPPIAFNDFPLGDTQRVWSPTTSIFIHGDRDAI